MVQVNFSHIERTSDQPVLCSFSIQVETDLLSNIGFLNQNSELVMLFRWLYGIFMFSVNLNLQFNQWSALDYWFIDAPVHSHVSVKSEANCPTVNPLSNLEISL